MIENEKFIFRIVSVEKLENIIISYKQIKRFIETLCIYMNHLSGLTGKDTLSNIRLKLEVDKSKELINYFDEVLRLKYDLNNLRISYNQVVLLIQAFICIAMFLTVEVSPLFDYYYIFPLFWLTIIVLFEKRRKNS